MEQVYPCVCPTVKRACSGQQGWFGVALWRLWPSLWPDYFDTVKAPSAFVAIERLMRVHGLWKVAYASARAFDGSLIYRAYTVFVPLVEEPPAVDGDETDDAISCNG